MMMKMGIFRSANCSNPDDATFANCPACTATAAKRLDSSGAMLNMKTAPAECPKRK